ncbi:MAG: biotin-dependent carboxyltransferase family protein, partial [Bacteroidia bacterium]|nr:biotin-dependent carboxyltransferase family protein [Bacteroidia bacterium]
MSLKVIKAGILDTVQDLGRFGFQYLGVNPGGVMDPFATQVVNMLVGNNSNEAVIEMHFPASAFLFEKESLIAIGGADFSPTIDGDPIPLWHPVLINKNSVLHFEKIRSGARCYLAIKDGLEIPQWLNSRSTNLRALAGGFYGRALQKNDAIGFKKQNDYTAFLSHKGFLVLPWQAATNWDPLADEWIDITFGNEWDWLDEVSQKKFLNDTFIIKTASDRMGYRLNGNTIIATNKMELISSAVSFGTIQLLPDGQLIVLMADHQTAGGYPRIAHVITA